MAALHGREDALLDAGALPSAAAPGQRRRDRRRAEGGRGRVRDLAAAGWQRGPAAPAPAAAAAAPPAPPSRASRRRRRAPPSGPQPRPVAARRENGQRFGVRFRRGSRGGLRPGEIPLIGVVQMDAARRRGRRCPAEAAAPSRRPPKPPRRPRRPRGSRRHAAEEGRRRARRRSRRRPRPPADDGEAEAARPRRKRPRARAAEEGRVKTQRRAATLPVSFFDRPADVVARELLGALVVSRIGGVRTSARIVETEAYLGYRDPASHGYLHRRNERNAALFGPPGIVVRLPVVRHPLVRQPGLRSRGDRERGAAARAGAGRGHRD